MTITQLTLREAIENITIFCPVKIIFNNIVLYNDFDSNVQIEDSVYGEIDTPLNVVPNRIWQFDKYVVTSINIEVVEFHHSIVTIQGEYREN